MKKETVYKFKPFEWERISQTKWQLNPDPNGHFSYQIEKKTNKFSKEDKIASEGAKSGVILTSYNAG